MPTIAFGATLYRTRGGYCGEEYARRYPERLAEGETMPRPKGSKNKKTQEPQSTQASNLAEALAFVAVAGTKDDAPYKSHVILNNGFAVATDGQLTAGFPITESLECCPQLRLLRAAIAKCGQSLAIAEMDNGYLSVKGDKFRAFVPCVTFDALPERSAFEPDARVAVIDDRLKAAFAACGVLASEAGKTFLEASLLLEANVCTSTNRQVMLQYWHGIDLPPNLVIPKIFAAAVCKVKAPLVGFGFKPDRSVTFHFENGAWIKTVLYEDSWPSATIAKIFEMPFAPQPVPPGLFEAIATVAEFNPKDMARLEQGRVVSHEQENIGAEFEVDGLNSELMLTGKLVQTVAPFISQIDLVTHEDRAFFFGDKLRGCIMACVKKSPEPPASVVTSFDRLPSDEIDEIPF